MRPQTLTYYNWTDIQNFLSEAMGITDGSFSRKKSTGFFSYWNLWLDLNDSFNDGIIRNDSYVNTDLSDYTLEIYKKKIIDTYVDLDGDETPLKLIDGMRKLREEIGKDMITIFYSW